MGPCQTRGKPLNYRVVDWKVWDVASGRVLASVAFPEGDADFAFLNTDGSRLAIALKTDDDASGTHEHLLMVVETTTGRRVVRRSLKRNLYTVQFSPDGRKLAGMVSPHETEEKYGPGNALLVWDAETGAEIRTISGTFPRGRSSPSVPTANASRPRSRRRRSEPEGRQALGGRFRSRSRLVPDGRTNRHGGLCFSPDGEALAAVAVYPTGDVLHVWDVGTARSRFSIPLRSQGLQTRAAFSPDGRRIACVLNGLQVGVWDVAECKQVATLQSETGAVYVIAFGRNGRELLAADLDGTVKIWDATVVPDDQLLDAEGRVNSLAVSPDARWIAGVVQPEGPTPWAPRRSSSLGLEGPIRPDVRPSRTGQGR